MSIVILGIDLGKNSCSVVGLDESGSVIVRRRMRRDGVIAFAAKLAPCTMAMEACCGAHHMGRSLAALGHEVRLMSPEYVRPYVKAQKNDDRDAEAIAEAATRRTLRFAVGLRTDDRARRLTGIPGIGALNATALVAAVGSAATFERGRDLAAWLGLVPRQATTGGRPKLLGITKRGSMRRGNQRESAATIWMRMPAA